MKWNQNLMSVVAGVVVVFGLVGEAGAELIPGVGIYDYSSYYNSFGSDRNPTNTVNESGLSTDGVGTKHSTAAGDMWLATDTLPNQITFDLGGNYSLTNLHVWNYNEGTGGAGASNVTVDVAMGEGYVFTTFTNLTFAKAGYTPCYGEDIPLNVPNNARLVRFIITSTHGGANAGLSEVHFYGTPLPATPHASIITNVTIAGFSSQDTTYNRLATYAIDESGLATNSLGVDHANSVGGNCWYAADPSPWWITLDLGAEYVLTKVHIWNFYEAQTIVRSASNVVVAVAAQAGGSFTDLDTVTLARKASQYVTDYGEDFDLSAYPAAASGRQVRLSIQSNYQGATGGSGLNEVRLYGYPPPSAPAGTVISIK